MIYAQYHRFVGFYDENTADKDYIDLIDCDKDEEAVPEFVQYGDWSVYVYGPYDSIDAALADIHERENGYRTDSLEGCSFTDRYNDEILMTVKPGRLHPFSESEMESWLWPWMECEIHADTTDEEIAAYVEPLVSKAASEGIELTGDVGEMIRSYRDGPIDPFAE